MKHFSYRERNYAFGQLIATLRTVLKLTQAELAERLGVSRQAVGEWESGNSYPKADHLKDFIDLGVQQHAFTTGREVEEIRSLWQAAHQKVLIDESWLQELLHQRHPRLTLVAGEQSEQTRIQSVAESRIDWGDALDISSFYGREEDLIQLSQWIVTEHCRVVSVLGLGGIGKSALAVKAMQQVAPYFEVVIFRSLRDAPPCEALLEDCLQALAPELLANIPTSLEERLGLLLGFLHNKHALLVLDNLEALLEEGESAGRMRAGYEGYARLLRQVARTRHQSCLLLTSREKPVELVSLEGNHALVRSLRLSGLELAACEQLLDERNLLGNTEVRARLIESYAGNPLAFQIVARTIDDLFGGEIALFLNGCELVFGGIRDLIHEQFDRLSLIEQTVLLWLAILREPVTMEQLLAVLATPLARIQVFDALEALRRRSLLERGKQSASFTLQSVVLEYATTRLIEDAASEIEAGKLSRLIEQGLELALSKEYVRQTQQRLLVAPLLEQLYYRYQAREELENRLQALLSQLRKRADYAQGYGPANVLALLRLQRGHLRGLDMSRLLLRSVYLQGVELQDATFSESLLHECVLTENFDAIATIAISKSGQYWAAANWDGKVRVWKWAKEAGMHLHQTWQAHSSGGSALAFSPDGCTLLSGGWDSTVKLWNVESGMLLWTGRHTGSINAVAFAPDGHLLASGGDDTLVQVWEPQSGTMVQQLAGQGGRVYSLTWSPDGRVLACGYADGSIRLWEPEAPEPDTRIQQLAGHSRWVPGLAFSPNGELLASASFDGKVKLWNLRSRSCLQTFSWHTDRAMHVAWSPDGYTLASCSFDHTVCLWDVEQERLRTVLSGHTAAIFTIAFTPDSRTLLSGSDDCTIRVWDVDNGQCLRVMRGYATALNNLDWSPDGRFLASGGDDAQVTLWDVASATPLSALHGHSRFVQGVAWSPDGCLLASGGYDSIRLWEPTTGVCLAVMRDIEEVETIFLGVAWSPDGHLLASGSYLRGVQVWEMPASMPRWVGRTEQPTRFRQVAWSSDGARLAGGGSDGFVYVWDATDGTLLQRLVGHHEAIISIAWNPNGNWLASAGGGREGGQLFVWEPQSGERVRTLEGHPGATSAVVWNPHGELLISGGSDGRLRWWKVDSGRCLRVREAHKGTIYAIKVSSDGSTLASCGDDGAIRLWNLHSGEPLQTLRGDRPYERLDISRVKGLTQAQRASLFALGAIEHPPVSDR